jgi:hypothetical protein
VARLKGRHDLVQQPLRGIAVRTSTVVSIAAALSMARPGVRMRGKRKPTTPQFLEGAKGRAVESQPCDTDLSIFFISPLQLYQREEMMSSKRFTYRISRVPAGVTASKLKAILVDHLGLGSEDNINVRSLARTPDVWTYPPQQTATIDFDVAPKVLGQTKYNVDSFELGDDDDPIVVDRTFLGFTPLNDVADEDHEFE